MDTEARIAQLKAELERLEGVKGNDLGFVAAKKVREALETIRVNFENINLEKQDETTLMTELKQINRASYTAICAIEQDLTERV